MSSNRLAQLESLFYEVLALPRDGRSAYIERNCRDEDLKRDLQSLLAHEDRANSFLESPVSPPRPMATGSQPSEWLVGQRVGHYVIGNRLSAGGMGEVYRARDTRLGREVAIKILPPVFIHDPARLAPFERESTCARLA
jgi:serine/threonine protein kinase